MPMSSKVYEIVTDKIIAALESGTPPRRKPWTAGIPRTAPSATRPTGADQEGVRAMKVTTVTATLRYSAEAQGAWRSIEVGAEATLTNSDESWETAQAELYHKLGQQLKVLWNSGNGRAETQEQAQPEAPASKPDHYCQEHQQEFRRHEKD